MPDKNTTTNRSAVNRPATEKKAAAKNTAPATTKQTAAAKKQDGAAKPSGPGDGTYVVLTDEQFKKLLGGYQSGGGNVSCCDLDGSVRDLADAVGIIAGRLVPVAGPEDEDRKRLSEALALSDVRKLKNTGSSYRDNDESINVC